MAGNAFEFPVDLQENKYLAEGMWHPDICGSRSLKKADQDR